MSSDKLTANLLLQGLSATVVVLSLMFVGLEVRESSRPTELNTQSLQLSTYQDLIAQIADVNMAMLENPGLRLRLQQNYQSSWEELSLEEQSELTSIAFLFLRHGDLAFYQYEIGLLSEDRLESALGPIRGMLLCRPAFRTFWDAQRDSFHEGYQQFISERLSALQGC